MNDRKAPNPLLPHSVFVPDAEAHVWTEGRGGGRIYLYGSFDIQGKATYCSEEYHVYSSDNLCDWVDHGVSFSLSRTAWAKDCGALYAPDCAYRDGIYYLYYCVPDGRCGAARSDKPWGPFEDVGPIAGVMGIDPAVFIDGDGQAYLYWGQFDNVRVAKLKDNMVEIDESTVCQPLSVGEHEFHEGSSVKKIGGRYYYLFTDTHRHGGRATSLGYAISDNPMTGFVYGGIIIDNFGCDPKPWNNPGSMECFEGQWYIFYHRSTHGSEYSRHVCAEPITINADGSIDEVKMTTSGMGAPLPACETIPACRSAELRGNVRIEADTDCTYGLSLRGIRHGDSALYRSLSFDGETAVTVTVRADGDCRAEIYLDGMYAASVSAASCDTYRTVTAAIPPVTGTHTVELRFFGDFASADCAEFSFA